MLISNCDFWLNILYLLNLIVFNFIWSLKSCRLQYKCRNHKCNVSLLLFLPQLRTLQTSAKFRIFIFFLCEDKSLIIFFFLVFPQFPYLIWTCISTDIEKCSALLWWIIRLPSICAGAFWYLLCYYTGLWVISVLIQLQGGASCNSTVKRMMGVKFLINHRVICPLWSANLAICFPFSSLVLVFDNN